MLVMWDIFVLLQKKYIGCHFISLHHTKCCWLANGSQIEIEKKKQNNKLILFLTIKACSL